MQEQRQQPVQKMALKPKLQTAYLEAKLQFLEEEERRLEEKVSAIKEEASQCDGNGPKTIQMVQLQGRSEVALKELAAVQKQRDNLVKEIRESA
jgi:hypothetical protein